MPAVKFSRVVSFSSEELPAFRADNLLSPEGARKWRGRDNGERRMVAVLALERATRISYVHLGNFGSAFVEVQVRTLMCKVT